ncbi:putative nucleotidyltransferase substrate binding domain-containing protein [Marinobacter mangrovi]|uniref:putative nucleotidyltransferase substrate binding domain-containing protein n=1 Tax=Marinobacter mangrovi TaxID=2803918 RepID=UPI0019335CE5|nr:putative nucleotidyltransferase substrate binding domain-containing protein [Marinobacter mangrovi]
MEVEQIEIRDHIKRFAPFDDLPEDTIDRLATQVEVAYYRAGSTILTYGEPIGDLYFIRSGAVEVYRRNGELYNRLSEGDLFGQLGLMMNKKVRYPATAIEDTLIYLIPDALFQELWEAGDHFADFFDIEDQGRLRAAVSRQEKANPLMTSRVRRLITRKPVSAEATVSIRDAARLMTDEGVSALILTNPGKQMDQEWKPGDNPMVAGIITDRDLRTRALAEGLDYDTPVSEIMSTDLVYIRSDKYVFEAMLTMLRSNVHHLPVLHRNKPVGVVALSDIVKYESQSGLYLVSNIHHQVDVRGLKRLSRDKAATFVRMVNEDANSHMIGSAMAGIGRAISQRLLELAEEQLGPPPIPYCFMALGSMARDEQLIVTDQDNALVLDDSFIPEEHDEYFKALAKFVSDGLAECGYTYCTGDIMATNQAWRQPLRVWKEYFTEWIEKPDAKSLLNSAIFFDLDGIAGNTQFAEVLKDLIATKAQRTPRFLAYLAHAALNRKPPLGFFRDFVMENDGKHNNSINLKRRGTAPLSDLVRVHALACGSRAQNTFNRINAIEETQLLAEGVANNLRDALELIAIVRIRHQALDIEAGRDPDNNIEPENLTRFERRNLKEAFQVISNAQKFLRHRYHASGGGSIN